MHAASLDQLFEDARSRAQKAPTDFAARSALWQIFAVRGERERARKQLDLMLQLDSSWALEVQACHGLLIAEDQRTKVFDGVLAPTCLGTPPDWFPKLIAALPMVAGGNAQAAVQLLSEVRDAVDACPGNVDKARFEWLCDGDARLGPCLELMVQGRYFWVPWQMLRSVATRAPTEVRDLLWQHALVEVSDESPVEGFIPVRYPRPRNSEESLSRITEWEPLGADLYLGYGQKCFMTNENSYGYLDVRSVKFDVQASR